MTDEKVKGSQRPPDDEQDVEGHNMWLDPGLARDMARHRNKDVEREVRERNRAKEAKSR